MEGLTLGWAGPLPHLVLGSHGNSAVVPRASRTAVAVERVQILALPLTGCVRWGVSLKLSEPHFPQLSNEQRTVETQMRHCT